MSERKHTPRPRRTHPRTPHAQRHLRAVQGSETADTSKPRVIDSHPGPLARPDRVAPGYKPYGEGSRGEKMLGAAIVGLAGLAAIAGLVKIEANVTEGTEPTVNVGATPAQANAANKGAVAVGLHAEPAPNTTPTIVKTYFNGAEVPVVTPTADPNVVTYRFNTETGLTDWQGSHYLHQLGLVDDQVETSDAMAAINHSHTANNQTINIHVDHPLGQNVPHVSK